MNSWITILDANYIRNDTYKNEPAHYNDNAKIQFLNAYSLIVVFISNALFIVLIMYNQCKKPHPENSEFKDYHAPIFNQLLFVSAFCLFSNNICVILRIIIVNGQTDKLSVHFLIVIAIEVILAHCYSAVFGCTLFFSLFAAVQRLLIIYSSKYKWLLTGCVLRIEMFLVYGFMVHYGWIIFWCDSEANVLCETESQNLLLLIHHTNFLVMTLITGYLHYHIYNLLERLSPENRTSRSRFLYQFLPIYAVQLAHSAAYFTATVIFKVWKVNFVKKVSFVSFIIAAPGISIIVSVSYIISEENVRTTVFTIMYPVWRELIS